MPSGQYAGPATIDRMPDNEPRTRYGIAIPTALRDRVRDKAAQHGLTVPDIIIALLDAYVTGDIDVTPPDPKLLDHVRTATGPDRRDAIRNAHAGGHRATAIAAAAGLSHQRISQLLAQEG